MILFESTALTLEPNDVLTSKTRSKTAEITEHSRNEMDRHFETNIGILFLISSNSKSFKAMTILKSAIGSILSFKTVEEWTQITNRVYSEIKDKSCRYMTLPSGVCHYFGELTQRQDLDSTVLMEFEGRMLPAPQGFDVYLRQRYSNYMQLPPEGNRQHHPYLALNLGTYSTVESSNGSNDSSVLSNGITGERNV